MESFFETQMKVNKTYLVSCSIDGHVGSFIKINKIENGHVWYTCFRANGEQHGSGSRDIDTVKSWILDEVEMVEMLRCTHCAECGRIVDLDKGIFTAHNLPSGELCQNSFKTPKWDKDGKPSVE